MHRKCSLKVDFDVMIIIVIVFIIRHTSRGREREGREGEEP